MQLFRVLFLMACLLSVCSCQSQPESDFKPSATLQCIFNLVRKSDVLILETRVRKELTVGQQFFTNTQHIPSLAVKTGEWNVLSIKQGQAKGRRIKILLDGKDEQFFYPDRGIFLKVFLSSPRKDGSYVVKGYFRRAVTAENKQPLEYIAVPFQLTLRVGKEKIFYQMEY